MVTIVEVISTIAPFVYILAAIGIFFSIRGIVVGRQARRLAAFGLEREAAQQRVRRSTNTLITLLLLCATVYITVNIVQPNLPESIATNDTTLTPEITPTPGTAEPGEPGEPTTVPLLYPTPTNIPGFPELDAGERALSESEFGICEYPQVNLIEPQQGANVTGQTAVRGQANVFPFSLYKLEVRSQQTNNQWIVVNTGDEAVAEGFLGTWDTTSFPPGEYTLRLIVYPSAEQAVPPCEVNVTIPER